METQAGQGGLAVLQRDSVESITKIPLPPSSPTTEGGRREDTSSSVGSSLWDEPVPADPTTRTVTIETADGTRMEVNTFTLARNSSFFRSFFYGPLAKSANGVFRISNVGGRMMSLCLQFLHGLESLTASNVDLNTAILALEAATYLALSKLEDKLISIICSLAHPGNLIQLYTRAEQNSPPLASILWKHIVDNFDKLYQNKALGALTQREMMELVKDETLDVQPKNEEAAIRDWCKNRPDDDKADLVELTREMQAESEFSRDGSIIYRKRYPRSILLSVGGWSSEGVTNSVESKRAGGWRLAKPSTLPPAVSYHGLVSRPEGLYVVGGFNGTNYFNTMHFFDYSAKKWTGKANMRNSRSYVSTAAIEGEDKFVAIGGFTGAERMATAEIYDVQRDTWQYLSSMNRARSDGAAVFSSGKVFVIGGFDGTNIHSSAEWFDFEKQQWHVVSKPMHSRRTGVCALSLTRDVFGVFGGFNSTRRLKSVELYDAREGLWHVMNEMNVTRSNFSLGLFESHVVVSGGYDGAKTTNLVESFDIRQNRWHSLPHLNQTKSALKVVRIDDIDVIRTFASPH